jgi:hypothetical protein
MWKGGNGTDRGTHGGGKRPRRAQPEDCPRGTIHSQDISSSPTESTCQDHERDQPVPGAKWWHHHRTGWTNHVGRFVGQPSTTTVTAARAL